METQVYRVDPKRPDTDRISRCARILRDGGLVAFPTETVYGLGADALNPKAVRKIYDAKGRPQDNPMIVHVASVDEARRLARRFPPKAELLCGRFWPGPLTLILPKAKAVPSETTAGLDTVALRMPDHPAALALIREAAVPVAAPSANSSGKPSPTSAAHVKADLNGKIDAILDAGRTKIGVESTVLDLTSKTPTILRPGGVCAEELRKAIGEVKTYAAKKGEARPRSPGMKYRHYAPKAPIILVEGEGEAAARKVKELADDYRRRGKKAYILKAYGRSGAQSAADLYGLMRLYDERGADVIIAEPLPEKGIGCAVMNRLRKAASKTRKA